VIVAEQQMPLYVPLIFLGWGAICLYLNRSAFRDFDGWLRRMAQSRARSRVVRLLGGTGDVEQEYRNLRRTRRSFLIIPILYSGVVIWFLVIALSQL
jgi:hypothetical protein